MRRWGVAGGGQPSVQYARDDVNLADRDHTAGRAAVRPVPVAPALDVAQSHVRQIRHFRVAFEVVEGLRCVFISHDGRCGGVEIHRHARECVGARHRGEQQDD